MKKILEGFIDGSNKKGDKMTKLSVPNGAVITFENCQEGLVFGSKEDKFRVKYLEIGIHPSKKIFCRERKAEQYSVERLLKEFKDTGMHAQAMGFFGLFDGKRCIEIGNGGILGLRGLKKVCALAKKLAK